MAKYIEEIIKRDFLKLTADHKIDRITVSQLLEPSGINRKTFYNHFSGISDLICAIFLDLNENTALLQSEKVGWETQIKNILKFFSDNERFVNKVVHSRYYGDIQLFFREHLTVAVKAFVESFSPRDTVLSEEEEEKIVYLYLPLLDALIKQWFRNGMTEPIDVYIKTIERIIAGGISECINYCTSK